MHIISQNKNADIFMFPKMNAAPQWLMDKSLLQYPQSTLMIIVRTVTWKQKLQLEISNLSWNPKYVC